MSEHPILHKIRQAAVDSEISRFNWRDRGRGPIGYYKGLALTYGRVFCKFKAVDPIAKDIAAAVGNNPNSDALAFLNNEFASIGLGQTAAGLAVLRKVFVLLTGLGMRESSGRYCEGRDRSTDNTTADEAEAGLFQTSFNAHSASSRLDQLFTQYRRSPDGFAEAFQQGVSCSAEDLENFGIGDGAEFQRLSKACPAFAVEFAAVGVRCLRRHWGPINRGEVQLRAESEALFRAVENLVVATPDAATALL